MKPEEISTLTTGDYITILGRKDNSDRSFIGEVFQIKAINLPFITAKYKRKNFIYGNRCLSFDTRIYDIAKLNDTYVKTITD